VVGLDERVRVQEVARVAISDQVPPMITRLTSSFPSREWGTWPFSSLRLAYWKV